MSLCLFGGDAGLRVLAGGVDLHEDVEGLVEDLEAVVDLRRQFQIVNGLDAVRMAQGVIDLVLLQRADEMGLVFEIGEVISLADQFLDLVLPDEGEPVLERDADLRGRLSLGRQHDLHIGTRPSARLGGGCCTRGHFVEVVPDGGDGLRRQRFGHVLGFGRILWFRSVWGTHASSLTRTR